MVLFDDFRFAAESVNEHHLERAVEIQFIFAFETVAGQNLGKPPRMSVCTFMIADAECYNIERVNTGHPFAGVGTERCIIELSCRSTPLCKDRQ